MLSHARLSRLHALKETRLDRADRALRAAQQDCREAEVALARRREACEAAERAILDGRRVVLEAGTVDVPALRAALAHGEELAVRLASCRRDADAAAHALHKATERVAHAREARRLARRDLDKATRLAAQARSGERRAQSLKEEAAQEEAVEAVVFASSVRAQAA